VQEHRKDTRVPVRLEVEWARGQRSRCPDVTSDLSLGGCYVESLNPVKVGEVLNLSLSLPANKTLRFRGEVRYHQPTIGFGIEFLQLSPFERATLTALIRYWAKRACVRRLATA
jgi:PilZ domain